MSQERRVVDGRTRKYYAITDKGLDALREAWLKIAELVGEVLDEHAPPSTDIRKDHTV